MAGDCPLEKICLFFKAIKNIKNADRYRSRPRYHSESKIERHFCPANMAG